MHHHRTRMGIVERSSGVHGRQHFRREWLSVARIVALFLALTGSGCASAPSGGFKISTPDGRQWITRAIDLESAILFPAGDEMGLKNRFTVVEYKRVGLYTKDEFEKNATMNGWKVLRYRTSFVPDVAFPAEPAPLSFENNGNTVIIISSEEEYLREHANWLKSQNTRPPPAHGP